MMKSFSNPKRELWPSLATRPEITRSSLDATVKKILSEVRTGGDTALRKLSKRFDGVAPVSLVVSKKDIESAGSRVSNDLKKSLKLAYENIKKFHEAQVIDEPEVMVTAGVRCWRKSIPLDTVGLYIPGGSAPLFSTILMLAIPAKVAGCSRIVLCTPPSSDGSVNPVILYAAGLCGIDEIYMVGGAQAIAAMAYGTESVPAVNRIFGPGNQFVTRAKQLVQLDGVSIDMPAGPSEVLIIADRNANPVYVAADLLSQAEHGIDSQVVLVTDDEQFITRTKDELSLQLKKLPRKTTAAASLKNSFSVLLRNIDECVEFSNLYAPEHLIINTSKPGKYIAGITNAGSVFLGSYSCESAGDYASGTNHTLPTNGYARSYSGVSTDSFVKKITFQELTATGLKKIGPAIEIMAKAENLQAHANAVTVRLKDLKNG